MTLLIAACLSLAVAFAPPADAPPNGKAEKTAKDAAGPAPRAGEGQEPKPEASKEGAKPAAGPTDVKAGPAPRPLPQMKTPQATEKLQEGVKKMESADYNGARTIFSSCLKDAATPADKKLLQGLIDDTRLGTEVDGARSMVERKDERKAIARVEKALKSYPESALRPQAERFIMETEELIYLILDDFEPGSGLEQMLDAAEKAKVDVKEAVSNLTSRWRKNMTYNSDPRFVRHGKGSMKWKVGGDYYGSYRYWYDGYGYQSTELKNPITKWRWLVFSLYMPEANEGALRVTLSPEQEMGVLRSLYSKKLVDLRGKRGWMDVRLDLKNDFGNTQNIKLEDIRFIRIEYMHINYRTIYMDFVHLE